MGISIGITSSVVGLKICVMTEGIKKYKSIIKKKKPDKIVLLGKFKKDAMVVLISRPLIDSHISHDEFFSVKNVLREYNDMKEETKNPETSVEYTM